MTLGGHHGASPCTPPLPKTLLLHPSFANRAQLRLYSLPDAWALPGLCSALCFERKT